jgi:general secretion pathway protein D
VTGFRSLALGVLAMLLAAAPLAAAEPAQRITPNFKDADITQIAEAVAAATGKNFIIDPRVRAQVTMLSSTPMSPESFYQAFLSILDVYGFIAVPAGSVVKILPDASARQVPSVDLPEHVSGTSDEIVTQVVEVKNIQAQQLVPILRPLVPQYGHLQSVPGANILIITDHASNVSRLIRIIRRIDQIGNQDPEIIPLQNASASEIVRVVNSLYQGPEASGIKVVADERSNSVLVGGDDSQRLRIRALIAHLDTPLESGGDTRVRYLHYAEAEKIAPKLKEQITGIAQANATGTGGAGGASPQAAAEKSAMVWADPTTNALVITAPPKIMRQVMDIVDKLDIRRPQVLVEAIIAEVDVTHESDLGVNWALYGQGTNVPVAGFISPVGGTSLVDLAEGALNPTSVSDTLLEGTTLGVGRVAGTGVNFAAMLRAIRSDTDTNVIATPSAVTMDNQEAKLEVAQEVPFITGQYTSGTAVTGGQVNPFQTIQRESVGTILKVTPTISAEGSQVMLKISIESSSLGAKPAGAVDLTTNKRTIDTTVLIEDGGVVALGGLIEDDSTASNDRVPGLGNIPIIGYLFKNRSAQSTKNNLIIFIRPKILTNPNQAAFETDLKYNYMIEQQKSLKAHDAIPLLPGVTRGTMPPLNINAPGLPGVAPNTPQGAKGPPPQPTGIQPPNLPAPPQATPPATPPGAPPVTPPATGSAAPQSSVAPGTPAPAGTPAPPDSTATPAPNPADSSTPPKP